MKYYLIVGEASGDLHASHLMAALKEEDPEAEFRFFGGDLMAIPTEDCHNSAKCETALPIPRLSIPDGYSWSSVPYC